jgi:hypothetical protein
MLRVASYALLVGLLSQAQGQIPGTGIPASVNSPTADGRQHGIPASVVSPQPPRAGINRPQHPVFSRPRRLRPFGTERRLHGLVPVPLFYPAYAGGYAADSSVADPSVDDTDAAAAENNSSTATEEDALRQAYLQGMRDGMTEKSQNRLGQHYMDSREAAPAKPSSGRPSPLAASTAPEVQDDSPSAVFVFKDGHQIETRNFAIMGQTLYNFTDSGLKKVELSDLDTAATQKANDDRGITVKLP